MMPFCSPAWLPTATHLLRKLRSSVRVNPLQRLGHGLIAAALLGATTLSSAGYSTGGGTLGGTGTVPIQLLQLTNTAINPTLLTTSGPSSTNPPTASFSVTGTTPALNAYLGYQLDIKNNNPALTISGTITLTFTVSVLNSAPAPTYDSLVLPAGWTLGTCTNTTPKGSVFKRVCSISLGQNTIAPTATKSVVVFLKSPLAGSGTSGVACSNATNSYSGKCVRLAASATSSSPAYTSNGANEEILLGAGGTTTANTTSNRAIRAYTAVRPAGGTLFTGYDTATTTGQFFAQVIVPTFGTTSTFVTSARLIESLSGGTGPGSCNSGSAFNACSRVDITVPAPASTVSSFYPNVLQIRLRIDNTNILSATATGLANTVLYYQGATGGAVQIPNCSPANTALLPPGGPCITARSLSSTTSPDYIFDLISYTNGGYYFR